jgi:hypothetical protein
MTCLRPTPRLTTTAFAGAGLGFGLWLVSPLVAGCAEPWDASFPFYTPVMLVGGALVGTLLPGHSIAFIFGVWVGQVLALAILPGHDRSWIALGAVTTAIGSLVSLPSYVAAAQIRGRQSAPRVGRRVG